MSTERWRSAVLLTVSLLLHALVLGAILAIVPITPIAPLMINLADLDERVGPTPASAPGTQPS
ncbi:MAG TPA: hypothetical protein VJU81_20690, partial [Methylomirabilota bacterium]|nr:hypothetical protein [Methylomirabilota bacterium]